jgi:hypothetical protein
VGNEMAGLMAGMGLLGVVLVFFWTIAAIVMPFFIWGIYSQTRRTAIQLTRIRALLESQASNEE